MLTLSFSQILFVVLLMVLYVVIWKISIKPTPRKKVVLHATSSAGMDKPAIMIDRLTRRLAIYKSKSIGKYIPGSLGLSAVSKAIIKDYGSILSRATRKYYAKQYKTPRFVYV